MNSMKTTKPDHVCRRCGYRWAARIAQPKACPRCKQYNWAREAHRAAIVQPVTIAP